MSYYEKISCRVAIQVCMGHFPDGRERHRTFSMKGVSPDAPLESIAAVVRALAPLLAYPITKVRKVVKRRIIIYEKGVVPWDDQGNQKVEKKIEPVPETPRIITFSVPARHCERRRRTATGLRTIGFAGQRRRSFQQNVH